MFLPTLYPRNTVLYTTRTDHAAHHGPNHSSSRYGPWRNPWGVSLQYSNPRENCFMECTMHDIFHGIYVTRGQVHGARRCQRGHFVHGSTNNEKMFPNPMPWPPMTRRTLCHSHACHVPRKRPWYFLRLAPWYMYHGTFRETKPSVHGVCQGLCCSW